MSIAEMKLAAIQEIGKLNDEQVIKEVLEHLAKLNETNATAVNIAKDIINERTEVLAKLAQ